jgi:hypothetical protein
MGGADGVAIVGGDEAGTLAAGTVLAAYLPRLWGSSGARLDTVAQQIATFLTARGVRAGKAVVTAMHVDSDRRGLKSITVRVPVAAVDAAKARVALEGLDLAHRRGQEPSTLNFANVAATTVEVWTESGRQSSASVRRSGLNPRTLTPPDDPAAAGAGGRGAGGRAGGPEATPPAAAAPAAPAAAAPAAGGAEPGVAAGAQPAAVATAANTRFDLLTAFTIDGWLGDAYPDLMADRVDTTILIGSAAESLGAAHIAARLGLESTGIALPIVRKATEVADPSRETNPILVGRDNLHVQSLVKIGRARLDDLSAGDGVVQIVPRAFGNVTATVVAGGDAAGTDAAAMYLARRAPYLWDNRRGSFTLEHLEQQVADFFGAKNAGGQAALAANAIDDVIKPLAAADKTIENFEAKVYLEAKNPALEKFLSDRIAAVLPKTPVKIETEAITAAVPVFEEAMTLPWEVDEFRQKLKDEVLPKVTPGATVEVDTRLSESPEFRRQLAEEVRAALVAAGAKNPTVRVRSAYKQGFLWMVEDVIPALKGKGAASIGVKVKEYKPDITKKYKFYTVPTRWLHELYPIDEICARDLGVPVSAFSMELVDDPKDTYEVDARDKAGKVVFHAAFSPAVVEREYLEKFPGWSRVEVTTGWVRALVNGASVVDARIETDPERFWDYYQGKVLPRIYDHVMKLTNNRPTADLQPFHRDLDIELWMSEPDFRIGVDEEQVSSLESLHEDLYFVTLDFYRAIGRMATPQVTLSAPGKIFPVIHPEQRGQPGKVRVLYAANAAPRARVELTYKDKEVERPTKITRDLTRVDVGQPEALRAVVRADRVRELEVEVAAASDREGLRATDEVDTLNALHKAGLYLADLSYDHVDRLAFSIALRDARARRVVAFSGAAPPTDVRTAGPNLSLGVRPALPVVTWDHVIGPDEAEEVVRKLAAFPQVAAYRAGRSYRGRDISVMEVTLPTPSEQISVTKYTAYKPTIFITGRQHANEVSSTSHILKLAELFATDPQYTALLKRINVILHPVENPDGAAMAYELQKLTPNHMLHAGRYSALGMDVGGGNALLPESLVRNDIWREWRPDIYLNPHGYPSHEWVQQFAGYVPPGFRVYLSSRGWYTQLSGLRDPRYPRIASATDALRDAIARALTSDAQVKALNLQHQDRYRRWAFDFAPFVYNQEIYEGAAIYYTDAETGEFRGGRRLPSAARTTPVSRQAMGAWPQVTFNSGMTEAPDETAQGSWLGLVSKMGFNFLVAHVKYLADGDYHLDLVEEAAPRDGVARTWVRVRPVVPKAGK